MQNETGLNPAERELEITLADLKPTAAAFDRDRLMFEAGRRSMRSHLRPHLHVWQGLAAACVVGLALSLAFRPEPRQVKRTVYVNAAGETVGEEHTPGKPIQFASTEHNEWNRERAVQYSRYLQLQRRILIEGLDALPVAKTSGIAKPEPPLTLNDLL